MLLRRIYLRVVVNSIYVQAIYAFVITIAYLRHGINY